MAEYESIHGTRVKYLSSDPTLDSSTEGQVWYNSTSGTNKALVQIKATSSGGNMSTPRGVLGGAGTQTAALGFGGYTWSPATVKNSTEEYNGYNWSNGGNMGTARAYPKGCGTQTAAVAFGGDTTNSNNETGATEEYNGSSWTAGGSLSTSRYNIAPAGIQTAAIGAGGYKGPASPKHVNNAEAYNGSTWTALTAMPEVKAWAAGAGTQTAALISGGATPAVSATSLLWNGSSWTSGGTMNTARQGIAGAGLSTAAIVYGNSTSNVIEEYDGSVWATSPATMSNSLFGRNSATNGTISAGLMFSGTNPPSTASAATEEYNSNINAIVKGAWASGGSLNSSRYGLASANAAPQNAGLGFGGYLTGVLSATESYNGSSWSNQPSMSTARVYLEGAGTQTAALAFGGVTFSPTSARNDTEEYGGSWTSGGAMNTGAWDRVGAGTQTAALASGGQTPSVTANSEEYNGSSWSEGNNLPATRSSGDGFGTQTAALYAGGQPPSSPYITATLLYDGTSWTVSPGTLNYGRIMGGAGGIQTLGFYAGGYNDSSVTEDWNGTAWSTSAPLSVARTNTAGAGSQPAGLVFGGEGPGGTATEEYSGGSSVTTASTLTTS